MVSILLWQQRTAAGLTLRELEQASGVSKTEINDIENGKKSPTLDTLELLAAGLKVSICDLFIQYKP